MHPFFTLFGYQISGYALMGLIGFGADVLYLLIACRKKRYSFEDTIYVFVLGMIGVMVGAKVLYLITVIPDIVQYRMLFFENPWKFISAYFYGGMVFYGGLLGGIAAAGAAARYFSINIVREYDLFVPAVPLFAGFGRLGCLMEGCCYGTRTSFPIHIVFRHSLIAPNNVPLVPTQAYEAAFDFTLFGVLCAAGHYKSIVPEMLDIYLVSYAVFRFVLEFFRGDALRGIFILSTSQWISLFVVVFVLIRRLLRTRAKSERLLAECGK